MNSIEVLPSDFAPTAVVAPENLVTETYIMKANSVKPYYDPAELTLWLNVGFDGDDAYIQGLASDANSDASQLWVKATKNEAGQYVIPANQFMGWFPLHLLPRWRRGVRHLVESRNPEHLLRWWRMQQVRRGLD